ncbi:MAG: ABC transporter ATP-binding protein [Acutalibacteraceae bacterium]|jgi:ATP-binding cassette subfamily B multidrug efflux pump
MKTVFRYLKDYYKRMALGFTFKIVATFSELMIPYILSHVLKNVIGSSVSYIVLWGSLMIICSIFACVGNVTANRMAAAVSKNFAQTLRRDLFDKTLRLSAAQTDRFTIPSLESRITTDTYNVHSFVNMMQRMGVRAPIMLAGGVTITLFMDAKLSLVMIALLPLIFITVYLIRRNGVPLYTMVQKSIDKMIRVVREDTQGIRVIKALSKTDYEHRRYDTVNKALVKDEVHAGVVMGAVNPIMTMFMNMGSVSVIALGAVYVSKGSSNPETVIAFMQYFTQISMAMMAVTRMFVMYTKCDASAKRIEEVLLCEEDITVKSKTDYPDIKTDAHIVFDNVTFSYKGKRNNLKDISFQVKKGGHIGIIGATGSGKSTIVKLLLRFYDVSSGGIYINGEDIRTIPKPALYAKFGSALQYDFLYADTIEENIKFGRDICHEDVVAAAKIAQAHDFITGFPEGYNHLLSPHGTNISGGQKQRVLISRALAGNPEILILDDSSSALDYKTDAALRAALSENLKETTVVTVAQRVSSVKSCDVILVIDHGEIIGLGTHEELLEKCEEYREISESQMGGAFVD